MLLLCGSRDEDVFEMLGRYGHCSHGSREGFY
jgi:hypothetical protein